MKIDWLEKLNNFLQTVAFSLAIATLQYAFQPDRPYEFPLVYSLCIGPSCWALIDFGRHLFPSARESGWPKGLAAFGLPFFGSVGGYFLGTLAADSYYGWSSWDARALPQLRVSLLMTAVAGLVCTYYFFSKTRSAHLETKIAETSRQASEAKLKLLETQIEPHMLFNTLANLRALITTDTAAALVMLDRMNDYLRATLKASRATEHPMQTEFDRLRDYLELMRVRMGPRLDFTLTLPPELALLNVPTLLLQPLVENAIKHGLEPKVQGGSISVTASLSGKLLTLEVADTGVGMPANAAKAPTSDASGFGVGQVRERLATAYGDEGTIQIVANNPAGTRAIVSFPSKTSP